MRPNILYLHCHDAGRYIEPYGKLIPTPHLQQLAEEGTLFRNAFAAAPTCSPSRAALLTGQSPHNAGMFGLSHRGWSLHDYGQHIIHALHDVGYTSVLAGVQHITEYRQSAARQRIGYQRVLMPSRRDRVRRRRRGWRSRLQRRGTQAIAAARRGVRSMRTVLRTPPSRRAEVIRHGASSFGSRAGAIVQMRRDRAIARAAARWLQSRDHNDPPFFMSVGFLSPHRPYLRAQPGVRAGEDPRFIRPPAPLPDVPPVRQDMANYIASVRTMDTACGLVLSALEESGLVDTTLVIATTDHGIAFPGLKCALTDHGLQTYLIMRGPGGFHGGQVIEGMVSQIDLYPTLCELLEIAPPPWLQGTSIMPLVRNEQEQIHDAIFGEVTYHAAYEPMRAVRTPRWKYIRRFNEGGPWTRPVLSNVDNGPSKHMLLQHGWAERDVPTEYLFDLMFDPNEEDNLADDSAYSDIKVQLAAQLRAWMERTEDPLLEGPIPAPRSPMNTIATSFYGRRVEDVD